MHNRRRMGRWQWCQMSWIRSHIERGAKIQEPIGGDAWVRSRRGCQTRHRGSETAEQGKNLLCNKKWARTSESGSATTTNNGIPIHHQGWRGWHRCRGRGCCDRCGRRNKDQLQSRTHTPKTTLRLNSRHLHLSSLFSFYFFFTEERMGGQSKFRARGREVKQSRGSRA
jgi:hypothetical protein